ncbi:MAG: AsmA-like C-terminal region-containing protein, partial [Pseudomonadota bacterium]
ARLGVTPVDIVWSQDFTASRDPSRLTLAGRFDASTADLLGIPTRSVLAGPVDLAIDARGRYRTFSRLDIAADFSDATLTLDDLAWRKEPGVLTALELTIRYGADGRQSGEVTIDGEGLDIQGTYSLFADGRLAGLAMPVVAIDRYADFSFEASRARGEALEALVSGSYINLGPVVERFLSNPDLGTNTGKGTVEDGQEGAAIDWGRGMKARLRFDRLELRNGISLADASLDIVHDSQNLKVLNLSGFDADRRPLSVLLSSDPADPTTGTETENTTPVRRTVVAETTNIGDLMRGIFGLTSLRGGAGQMTLSLADRPGGPIGGTLAARGLQVVDAPMLAKLFAAGSLEALADLMSDQGIALQSVEALFEIDDGKIDISAANAVGPSVGLSAAGTIGLDGTGVALAGALAPIYQINAILGNTPLIGPLLVNRKGEGLLAVSYEITGEVTAPMVTIKPLSALAPGVLRRAFENERRAFEDRLNRRRAPGNASPDSTPDFPLPQSDGPPGRFQPREGLSPESDIDDLDDDLLGISERRTVAVQNNRLVAAAFDACSGEMRKAAASSGLLVAMPSAPAVADVDGEGVYRLEASFTADNGTGQS